VGTLYSLPLTLSGATGALTFTLVPGNHLPPGLSLNGTAGLLSGTPTESGQFWFTLEAADTGGHTLVRSLNIYIFPAGQTPPVSIAMGSNLGIWTIGEVQDALNASGGNGTYSWSLVSGSLPPGVSIRTDVPSFFPAGTGAGLIGIATTPGTYNFTLSVTSGGTTASQAFMMKIANMTLKDVYNVPNGFLGVPYSYTFTPLNPSGPLTWTATSALPPGLTFSSGVISGTPTQTGNWSVNFQFTDGIDTVFRSFGITVYAIHFTTSGLLPNATQGVAYTTNLAASGGTGSLTFAASNILPNGLSLTSSGTISGTPNTGPGRYGFSVTATDANNVSYTSTFSIDVIGVPPSLPSLDPINVNVIYRDATIGFGYARIVSVFSGGTAPFTWSATGLPPGMSIRPWDQAERILTPDDAEIWGTPTALGTFNAQVTVRDANGATASLAFPFSVSALGVDGNDNLPNGAVGAAYSKTLRVLGGKGPYTVSLFNSLFQRLPAGLALGGMVVSGTPTENGAFTPVLQFQDSVGNVLQLPDGFTITGTVGSTITINQSFNLGTIGVGSGYSFQLGACCTNSGQFTWSLVSGTLPPGVTLSSVGVLSGIPTIAGTFVFVVKAADPANAGNFGERQFQLVVTPLTYTTSTTLPNGTAGLPYNSGSLLTSLSGAVGTVSIGFEAGSYLPPGLTMSGGSISGTPLASGRFGFILIFTDAANNTLIRGFTLSIYPAGGPSALQLVTLPPCRIMDTRNPAGPLGGPFIAGTMTRTIPIPSSACGVPENAAAYSLNITVVPRAGTLGYLTVWPTGQSQPFVSTLNSIDGSVLANAAIVPAGTNGSIDAYATDDTELIIDINGYFVPPTTGSLQFYPLTPCRILDTRNPTGTFGGPSLAGLTSRSFPVPSSGCGVPAGAAAYSLNMTVVPQGLLGYLTTWPTGQTQPVVSTLNSLDGTVLANAAIVPAGTNGAVSFFANNTTDLIVDINGYFAPPSLGGLNFYTATPCRIVDTRNPAGTFGGPILNASEERTFPLSQGSCGLPATAAAYSLNMTVVPSGFLGYLATWPAGGSQPVVSTLNAYKGQVVANAAIVPAGASGAINVYVTNTTHVIIDTNGFFAQ
jgi:large repetitive protein